MYTPMFYVCSPPLGILELLAIRWKFLGATRKVSPVLVSISPNQDGGVSTLARICRCYEKCLTLYRIFSISQRSLVVVALHVARDTRSMTYFLRYALLFLKTMSKVGRTRKINIIFIFSSTYLPTKLSFSFVGSESPRNWFRFRGTFFFITPVLTFSRERNDFRFRFRGKVRTGLTL